jgi:hypothetical protein
MDAMIEYVNAMVIEGDRVRCRVCGWSCELEEDENPVERFVVGIGERDTEGHEHGIERPCPVDDAFLAEVQGR